MKLDPRQLEVVAAIVDHGGLTEGAAALGKSQPSVSRTISQLEGRIGAPLFVPGRRPMQPTDLGRALAETGRRIHEAGLAATQLVQRFRAGTQGLVRVGGTPIFMDGVVSGMIAEFQQRAPEVRVDQSYGYSDELVDRVRTGAIDVAVCPMQPAATPTDLVFDPILPGLNVIACRAGHPLTRRSIVTGSDIAAYPWIAPPRESPLYRDLERALESLGARDFKISFSGGSLSSVVSILTGSDALTVLPYSVVFMLRAQRTIATLSLKIEHPDRSLGLLYAGADAASPAETRFRQFIADRFLALTQRIMAKQREAVWRGSA
jgi:DNA-binding transcriptional LysR family regulator